MDDNIEYHTLWFVELEAGVLAYEPRWGPYKLEVVSRFVKNIEALVLQMQLLTKIRQ